MISKNNKLREMTDGLENNEVVSKPLIKPIAEVKLSDLKNIHAKTVIPNVISIETNSFTVGKNLPFATISKCFLFVLKMMDGSI